ncbi:BON domain-containing protein [Methylocaldum sp.]|uniref:BON domain-containing protein n=1 Tax=Methylocaldum sp. TaxID=1969727 RepID=UPI002D73880B|nr:BON domain-containing protein [Methylocaldum sp.]HYE37411.1 BON domain-containing protein [Methylocaldum sp.]
MIKRIRFFVTFLAVTVASFASPPAFAETGDSTEGIFARTAGEYMSDKAIAVEVKSALLADPSTSGIVIQVETDKGIVQLGGLVDSEAEKKRVVEIARGVEGVMDVKHNISVGGGLQ